MHCALGKRVAAGAAIGGKTPDFIFTTSVANRINPFPVWAECGFTRTAAYRECNVNPPQPASTGQRNLATRSQRDALTAGGKMSAGEKGEWFFQESRALLVIIRGQFNRQFLILAGSDVELM